MRTIIIAASLAALALAGCARRAPIVTTPPPAGQGAGAATGAANDEVGLVELPDSQRALVAAAGSDTIHFDTDQSTIRDQDRAVLAAQAKWLLANPAVRASVEGHADERGTREYNIALGERRANSTKSALAAMGIDAGRLNVISYGKERPDATGSDEASWAKNRRAVTVTVQ